MMGKTVIILASIVVLALSIYGCGAFADAASDGNEPNGNQADLIFDGHPIIYQGHYKEFVMTFSPPPPWADQIEDPVAYIHDENLSDNDDINFTPDYDGRSTINAKIYAFPQAKTGERIFSITVVFGITNEEGRQSYSGTGSLHVIGLITADSTDGGTQ